MMLLNRDSAIQSASKRFYTVCKSEKSDPLKPSGRRDIPSECPTVQSIIRPDLPLCRVALNCSSLILFRHFSSTSGRHSVFDQLWDFLPKHRCGKIIATVRMMWIPIRTHSSIRQVLHLINRSDDHSVSILASFCVWTKSLICKDVANRDSTIQSEGRRNSSSLSAVRTIVPSRPDAYCSCFFRLDDVPSRPDTVNPASSVRTMCFFRPDTYTVSRSFCASLLRIDVSVARPDAYQFSNGSLILSKFQEREDQSTVRTMWYTVRTRISVRKELQFEFHRPNA
jgi:hypothetical protein